MPPTHPDARTYTRPELYNLVWSTPIVQLSKTLGISGPGLAKLCRRHSIPCPPRGYWAKLRYGKKVRKTRLPRPGDNLVIKIWPSPARAPGTAGSKSASTGPPVVVQAELRSPHRPVRSTRSAYRARRAGQQAVPSGVLDLSCTADQRDRALRIWDALIKAVEASGGQVVIEKKYSRWITTVALGADPVPISMRERLVQEPNPEREHPRKGQWATKYIQRPSGRLEIKLDAPTDHGGQSRWADGKKLSLEDRLPHVLDALAHYSVAIRDRRLHWEEVHRKRAEEERARQEREEHEWRLEAELQGLLKVVDQWRKTRDIRSLVRAVVRRAEETDVDLTPGTQLREWIDWASWQADRIDPLLAASRAREVSDPQET